MIRIINNEQNCSITVIPDAYPVLWSANKSEFNILKTIFKQKKPTNANMIVLSAELSSCVIFKKEHQSMYLFAIEKTKKMIAKIATNRIYVVLISCFINFTFPLALATAYLFLKPCPSPKSKYPIQATIELIVSHMPYCSPLT